MMGYMGMVILTVHKLLLNCSEMLYLQLLWMCYPHQCLKAFRNKRMNLSFKALMWTTSIKFKN